jgi:DNA helicase MCM8
VRLAEARARLELRDFVSRADALDVTEVLKDALFDLADDGLGNAFDFGRQGGAGMSDSKRVKAFVAALQAESRRTQSRDFQKADIMALATALGAGGASGARDLLDRVHEQGFIGYAAGVYKLFI